MINLKRNRYLAVVFAALLAVMILSLVAQVSSAGNEPRPNVPAQVFAVPTPITTPSSLDALSTTSDVIVGGNSTIAGTLGVTGATNLTGALTTSGGQTNSNWFAVAAPTGIATATPALVVNSAGVSRLFELQKNATPVASIDGTGIATFANGLTVTTGTVALPASEIGSTEIANISRTVAIPLNTFYECSTNAGVALAYSDGTDAHPFYSNSSTDGLGRVIAFDATSGSPDTDYICSDLVVPQDFASGALFVVRATKGAETGANSEVINCQGSINGAALGTAGTVTTSGTAIAAYTCTPTLTSLAAGDGLGFTLRITSGGTADDTVNFVTVEFRYTATE